ncbi:hypothetical protein [Mannheimia haemolytica]|nr:hypothetical protein [Mannheimia haemolytica]
MKAGEADTDAVNVSQLKQAAASQNRSERFRFSNCWCT